MKFVIPWILVGALIAGGGYLFVNSRQKDTDIERLKAENAEIAAMRAEIEELKKRPDYSAEVVRLRKDNEDLLRLRNEVKQLRDQSKQLGTQLQTAQAQRDQIQAQQQQAAQAATEAEAARAQLLQKSTEKAQLFQCINNLRQIEAAKDQWALQNGKPPGSVPSTADILPFLNGKLPACPNGGTYLLNAVGKPATCSVAGHVLPAP
jgi:chromosome segregation ATPase